MNDNEKRHLLSGLRGLTDMADIFRGVLVQFRAAGINPDELLPVMDIISDFVNARREEWQNMKNREESERELKNEYKGG